MAIEFSRPDVAWKNINQCLSWGLPLVCGTTGWLSHFEEACRICKLKNASFLYASNFSVGVNVFFHLNRYLAKLMKSVSGYDVSIKEIHHLEKRDAPSGTAITLAEDIIGMGNLKNSWFRASDKSECTFKELRIESERIGNTPGTHIIDYRCAIDEIEIKHTAYSRDGFALGAVLAAEYIAEKKGVFTMDDVLGLEK